VNIFFWLGDILKMQIQDLSGVIYPSSYVTPILLFIAKWPLKRDFQET